MKRDFRGLSKILFAVSALSCCTASAASAASPSEPNAITIWKRQVARQLVPLINGSEFKSLATEKTQTLYIRFQIDANGKAQSISFTAQTEADSRSKIAVQQMISTMDFRAPPSDAGIEWLVLPVTIQRRN